MFTLVFFPLKISYRCYHCSNFTHGSIAWTSCLSFNLSRAGPGNTAVRTPESHQCLAYSIVPAVAAFGGTAMVGKLGKKACHFIDLLRPCTPIQCINNYILLFKFQLCAHICSSCTGHKNTDNPCSSLQDEMGKMGYTG